MKTRKILKTVHRLASKALSMPEWCRRFRLRRPDYRRHPVTAAPRWSQWYQMNKRYQKYRRFFPDGPQHLPRHMGWWPK